MQKLRRGKHYVKIPTYRKSTINVPTLLYYVHMTKYNQVNCKFPRVLIMHVYILVRFHIRRRFHASLSVRVSYLGQPVMYDRQYCKNKPSHKLYHCIPEGSTRHYTLLHNPTIIYTRKNFAQACHMLNKI